ncbi:MAG TPA: methionyl-tRNA formyltransferase [Rhodocyclaceae bacterium]|jgi:methionyl-tRNA formyltransferase|nr:methionyl-tRNA formyltransferase [Rhodocyclaceae bacterium]
MKVIFAGTPEFAAQALRAILAAGHEVPLVLTQPDRPAGRGQKLQPSPVKQVALEHGIPVHQPERLKDPATHQPIIDAAADVMVVAAYGLILPQAVLDIPRHGCLNIHGSLLPRWRGAAPIQRAIEAGDKESGVVIMQMEAGLDTGPMLLTESLSITDDDTAASLHDKLAAQGARLIVDALARLPELQAVPQPEEGVTYAHKIEKAEAAIDWNLSAEQLARRIRAFNPFPGATAKHGELLLKCWQAQPIAGQGKPGQVLAADGNGVVVACGSGALCLTELQKPGGKRLLAADFLRGHPLQAGDRLG